MALKSKTTTIIMIALGVVAIGSFAAAQYLGQQIDNFDETMASNASEVAAEITPEEPTAETPAFDLEAALKPRTLGNPDAPIKISEYASLTCGHCANFHKDVFKDLKKEYIDTGKAYFVFADFPLNAPALQATMAARCVPEDNYFDFISLLFEEQRDWAFGADYLGYLKAKAAIHGLKGSEFNTCIRNKALQDGIIAQLQEAQKTHNISATPSFVINDSITIMGSPDLASFEKKIQDALAQINGGE